MIWTCLPVAQFWNNIAFKLSVLVHDVVPVLLNVLILNDLSGFHLTKSQKRAVFVGLTAAIKMIATCWKPPHDMSIGT